MELNRIIIYPKDVQRITGKSERYGRYLLQQIRVQLKKEGHQFITLSEFSEYTGIEENLVKKYLD